MSEWGWVGFAYGVTYVSLVAYVYLLAKRLRTRKAELEDLG